MVDMGLFLLLPPYTLGATCGLGWVTLTPSSTCTARCPAYGKREEMLAELEVWVGRKVAGLLPELQWQVEWSADEWGPQVP